MTIWKVEYEINLLTIPEYEALPIGTVLHSISGHIRVKSEDSRDRNSNNYIDYDTRHGYLAYGIRKPSIFDDLK